MIVGTGVLDGPKKETIFCKQNGYNRFLDNRRKDFKNPLFSRGVEDVAPYNRMKITDGKHTQIPYLWGRRVLAAARSRSRSDTAFPLLKRSVLSGQGSGP